MLLPYIITIIVLKNCFPSVLIHLRRQARQRSLKLQRFFKYRVLRLELAYKITAIQTNFAPPRSMIIILLLHLNSQIIRSVIKRK